MSQAKQSASKTSKVSTRPHPMLNQIATKAALTPVTRETFGTLALGKLGVNPFLMLLFIVFLYILYNLDRIIFGTGEPGGRKELPRRRARVLGPLNPHGCKSWNRRFAGGLRGPVDAVSPETEPVGDGENTLRSFP